MSMFPYLILAAGSILWCAPFPVFRSKSGSPQKLDRRARWGIALECLAYTLLWQGPFWERSPQPWRVAASVALFGLAALISWSAARALGRQLRLDAAVSDGHELIRSGPYQLMRHPIYTSMLCVLLATGLLLASLPLLVLSVVVFLAGTQIRMRIEDRLLASSFGTRFVEYQRSVPPLLPLLKW